MYVDPRWELKWLGEDPGGILVETPDGEIGVLDIGKLENYAKVDNKLIPKNSIDWL
jgi:hypothetical protein